MPFLFTIINVPKEGDKVIVSLTDGDGINRAYEYEVQEGQDTIAICNGIVSLINEDVYFTAAFSSFFDDPGVEVNQVTDNSYNLFSGIVTIEYNPDNITPAYTMVWDEPNNAFEGERSYQPEWMVCLGTLLVTFKNGSPYSHDSSVFNNFYGIQYESFVIGVANDGVFQKKTWISLSEVANTVWTCPLIYTNMNSYGNQRQETNLKLPEFRRLENEFAATIKRDINSPGSKNNGASMKGSLLVAEFEVDNTRSHDYVALSAVNVKIIDSPLNNR